MTLPAVHPPHPGKIELIDRLSEVVGPKWTFADLGGVWGVHGAYSFHALGKPECSGGMLVDTHPSPLVSEKAAAEPRLRLIKSNFGERNTAEELGAVDAVFFFDVLLHQVAPDWDVVLSMYAKQAKYFLIFNQQFMQPATTRLLDLGEDEYFRNAPHDRKHPVYKNLFTRLNETHPDHPGRKWRDVHHIWQWGITDRDLHACLTRLGFRLDFFRNWQRVLALENFENHAFLYSKQ